MPSHVHQTEITYLAIYGSTDTGQSKITGTRVDVGGTGSKKINSTAAGGGKAFEIMPPYVAACVHVRAG